MSKRKNFTVRLSEHDEQLLDTLAQRLDTDRSAAMRHALRQTECPALTMSGIFTPANVPQSRISVQLTGGADHE